jgi:hypothetical protein
MTLFFYAQVTSLLEKGSTNLQWIIAKSDLILFNTLAPEPQLATVLAPTWELDRIQLMGQIID